MVWYGWTSTDSKVSGTAAYALRLDPKYPLVSQQKAIENGDL
jgi:hypothetical protein